MVTFSDPGKNMSPHRVTPLLCFKVPRSQSLLASHCCRSLTQLEYFQGMEAAPWQSQQIGVGVFRGGFLYGQVAAFGWLVKNGRIEVLVVKS